MFDQKRRLMHKEIERKRRDKINDWIGYLAKIVPDCAQDHTKQVSVVTVDPVEETDHFVLGTVQGRHSSKNSQIHPTAAG